MRALRRPRALGVVLWAGAQLLSCGPRSHEGQPSSSTTADAHPSALLPTLAGPTLDLDAAIGSGPLVLVFWATWCGPCYDEAPHLVRLYRRFAPKGVAFVSVSVDDPSEREGLRAMVAELGLPYPVGLDPDERWLKRFLPSGTVPLTLLFDARGEVVYRNARYRPGDERRLEAALEALTARESFPL